MPRAKADVANTAVRIFLQEAGAVHDQERGLDPYRARDFTKVKEFFGNRCCYCDADFNSGIAAVQDHLIPMNKADLGLHAWGNVVPACRDCNAKKQGRDWKDFIIERAGPHARERHGRVQDFLRTYRYGPSHDIRKSAKELYDEVGDVAMTLVQLKVRQLSRP